MVQTKCRHFNGYKPCGLSPTCSVDCSHKDLIQKSVLIIHLGALGAVVRSTSLLEAIHQKYPKAHLTWVTDKPADQILRGHPRIDRLLTTSAEDLLLLGGLRFDAALVIDKSLKAYGVLAKTQAQKVFGFVADPQTGAVLPATDAAQELWQLGLSNQKKFFENQKSEVQLMIEALELPWTGRPPEYNLPLTTAEKKTSEERRQQWSLNPAQPVIGFNTGCSSVLPAKKLPVSTQRQLIRQLWELGFENLVLLGGPEDKERNLRIGEGLPVFQSPTDQGLRDGLVSVAACDLVVSGDSLGMHFAISQKKFVTAWFGPSCPQEIELYGRGEKILTKAACAPCWKRACGQSQMCYDQVSLDDIVQTIRQGHEFWRQQRESFLSKPHF